jgi:hypothetical protein
MAPPLPLPPSLKAMAQQGWRTALRQRKPLPPHQPPLESTFAQKPQPLVCPGHPPLLPAPFAVVVRGLTVLHAMQL